MELTAEQFAEIVRELREHLDEPLGAELRRAPRVDREARVTIMPIAGSGRQRPAPVMVKNLSSRGLAFVREVAMECGSQFLIHLTRRGAAPIELLCTVAHCHPAGENRYWIGAEFTCLSPEARRESPADPQESDRIRHSMLD